MYQRLHMWDEALSLAMAKANPGLGQLRADHMTWLMETGQEERAAAIKEEEGDLTEALNLFLR